MRADSGFSKGLADLLEQMGDFLGGAGNPEAHLVERLLAEPHVARLAQPCSESASATSLFCMPLS
jgi:hypothetical protein